MHSEPDHQHCQHLAAFVPSALSACTLAREMIPLPAHQHLDAFVAASYTVFTIRAWLVVVCVSNPEVGFHHGFLTTLSACTLARKLIPLPACQHLDAFITAALSACTLAREIIPSPAHQHLAAFVPAALSACTLTREIIPLPACLLHSVLAH